MSEIPRRTDAARLDSRQAGWDDLHDFERAESAASLAGLDLQQGYAQFLSAYLLFGVRIPDDLKCLVEADFRDRVAIVARRQRAFAALAAAAAEREGLASR
jgi:hypothetical protein